MQNMPITPQPPRLSVLFVETPHVGFTPNAFTFCMYFRRGRHMSFIALCPSAPYRPYYHNSVTHLCSYRLFPRDYVSKSRRPDSVQHSRCENRACLQTNMDTAHSAGIHKTWQSETCNSVLIPSRVLIPLKRFIVWTDRPKTKALRVTLSKGVCFLR